jgi:fructose-bisphosphate aldolase class 1
MHPFQAVQRDLAGLLLAAAAVGAYGVIAKMRSSFREGDPRSAKEASDERESV